MKRKTDNQLNHCERNRIANKVPAPFCVCRTYWRGESLSACVIGMCDTYDEALDLAASYDFGKYGASIERDGFHTERLQTPC